MIAGVAPPFRYGGRSRCRRGHNDRGGGRRAIVRWLSRPITGVATEPADLDSARGPAATRTGFGAPSVEGCPNGSEAIGLLQPIIAAT